MKLKYRKMRKAAHTLDKSTTSGLAARDKALFSNANVAATGAYIHDFHFGPRITSLRILIPQS